VCAKSIGGVVVLVFGGQKLYTAIVSIARQQQLTVAVVGTQQQYNVGIIGANYLVDFGPS
jgi:hypothetical protein